MTKYKDYPYGCSCGEDPEINDEYIKNLINQELEKLKDIYMPQAYEGRYRELKLTEDTLISDVTTGAYTPQGGCSDGTYIYRCMVKEDEENTIIQKLDMTGKVLLEKTNYPYGHANDMTYCSKDGLLYIAHSSSTSIVYKVDPTTLDYVGQVNVGASIWGIDYNATDDVFVLGNVGASYLSVYTYDFDFMYRIKMQNAYSGLVRQGITSTENYIFVNLDNTYGAVIENNYGSRIMVYTWNGMFVKSFFLDIKEIEFASVVGNELIIGTYEGRDASDVKSGKIYKVKFDLYPEQTNMTGRPTDVSGGLNNLQRLPEGTPVRLWKGSISSKTGEIKFQVPSRLKVTEDSPFRYLRFRFKGANQQVFDWYPAKNGVVTLREMDISEATTDSTIRFREMRLSFDETNQKLVITDNKIETIFKDDSENTITITKDTDSTSLTGIEVTQIWGIV